MAIGILGRKVGMTQLYDESGQVVPVTVIQAGPCDVLQIRTIERDGYEAVQLGFADKPRRLASRSDRGHVAKLDSKRSKRRNSARRRASRQGRLRAEAVRPRNPRRRPASLEVGGQVKVDALEGVDSRRHHGHLQRPRLCRRHQAAQFLRPAGHARRQEMPPRTGRHRRQRVPQPRHQRQADAGPVRQRQDDRPQSEAREGRRREQPAS